MIRFEGYVGQLGEVKRAGGGSRAFCSCPRRSNFPATVRRPLAAVPFKSTGLLADPTPVSASARASAMVWRLVWVWRLVAHPVRRCGLLRPGSNQFACFLLNDITSRWGSKTVLFFNMK